MNEIISTDPTDVKREMRLLQTLPRNSTLIKWKNFLKDTNNQI